MAISTEERLFFVELGGRIAQLRKACGLTQVQLAEVLALAQQTVQAYEAGVRRVPVSSMPQLAKTLGVSLEELFGEQPAKAPAKRGPAPKLQQHLERISALPKAQQKFVMQVIESVLAQADAR